MDVCNSSLHHALVMVCWSTQAGYDTAGGNPGRSLCAFYSQLEEVWTGTRCVSGVWNFHTGLWNGNISSGRWFLFFKTISIRGFVGEAVSGIWQHSVLSQGSSRRAGSSRQNCLIFRKSCLQFQAKSQDENTDNNASMCIKKLIFAIYSSVILFTSLYNIVNIFLQRICSVSHTHDKLYQ